MIQHTHVYVYNTAWSRHGPINKIHNSPKVNNIKDAYFVNLSISLTSLHDSQLYTLQAATSCHHTGTHS